MKHQIMSTLAAVCLVLLVFSGPAFAATYEVQSVTGTVAPYSTQNPYSPSLSVLLPTPKVSGSVTNSTINIQPILVTVSTPKGTTTQSFEGSGVPLTKAQNESYMSFGVWKAFSSSNPVTAWQTNGAYEAGTLSTTFPQSTVSYVGQAEAWITYRSSTPLKPSALLVGSSRLSIDFVHGLVDVTIAFPSPSIALHGSVPLSATKHAYMSSSANLSGTGALVQFQTTFLAMLLCPLCRDCVGGGRLRPSLWDRVRVRVLKVLHTCTRTLTPRPLARLCRRRAQPFPRGEGA